MHRYNPADRETARKCDTRKNLTESARKSSHFLFARGMNSFFEGRVGENVYDRWISKMFAKCRCRM